MRRCPAALTSSPTAITETNDVSLNSETQVLANTGSTRRQAWGTMICFIACQTSSGAGKRPLLIVPVTVVSTYHATQSAAIVAMPIHVLRRPEIESRVRDDFRIRLA